MSAAAGRVGLLVLAGTLGEACVPATGPPAPARPASQRATVVETPRTIITPKAATSIPELFAAADRERREGHHREAARAFDRVVALDPDGPWVARALFHAAAAHDELAEHEAALARYEQLARRFPDDGLAVEALVRAARLTVHLERWSRAGQLAERLLARSRSVGPLERIVAYGAKALALLSAGDGDAAAHFVERGRAVVEEHRLDTAGRLPRDLAPLYYALGELRRLRGEAIRFTPLPDDFTARLEERCRLLLDAQSAYSESMRAYDAHWSAMAGYRVGELYERLHADLMRIPRPPSAGTVTRQELFEGALRLRYAILLRKGLAMMEHTLQMAERTGERSRWVQRAAEARARLDAAIQQEERALDRLPYTRAELQEALDRLREGHQ